MDDEEEEVNKEKKDITREEYIAFITSKEEELIDGLDDEDRSDSILKLVCEPDDFRSEISSRLYNWEKQIEMERDSYLENFEKYDDDSDEAIVDEVINRLKQIFD